MKTFIEWLQLLNNSCIKKKEPYYFKKVEGDKITYTYNTKYN